MSKPDKAVLDARIMADNGYNAREIAEALSKEHGKVSRFTVYDWLRGRYRRLVKTPKTPNESATTSNANDLS